MVIFEIKKVSNTRTWFVRVTIILELRTQPLRARKARKRANLCSEDATPMENQPSNVNPRDEWDKFDKWAEFLRQDGLHGESGTSGRDSGSADQPRDVREVIPEIEGKSMVISIVAGEALAAPGYTVT